MTSPFASQLGTNYCPKDEEVQEIKNLLLEPTLRLKRLGDEIADLQTAIDKLAEERDTLEAYVEGHRALMSPVRRLPLDIIQEIFIACLPDDHNCVMGASEAPVLLGRICSSWRATSLDTPRLWAKLHIVEPASHYGSTSTPLFEEKVAQRLETTKMWLGRSGQCLLSISLECAPENDLLPVAPSTSAGFIEALIPFASRWQHIQFAILPSTLGMISSLHLQVPALETIAFHFQPYRSMQGVPFGPFAMLRGARISGFAIPGSVFLPEKFPLRWNQLTNLSIGGHPWTVGQELTSEAILHALSGCPELRHCKLMVNDVEDVEQLQHAIVELPFLHTLDLHSVSNVAPAVLFLLEHLSMPELRNFTFFGYADGHNSSLFSLSDFFARSTRLESLDIDSTTFTRISLLDSLRCLPPTIQRLGIHDRVNSGWGIPATPSFDDEALELLMPATSCPALQHLSIAHCSSISDTALLHFITAKMGQFPTTLTHVDVQFDRHMTLDILPNLKAFTALDISITHLLPPPSQFSPWQGLIHAPW